MKEFNLQLFANLTTDVPSPVNKTTDVSYTMKQFYDTQLLENARTMLYFNQFGKKQPLPKNNGKSVEWRKFNTYSPATTPLTEGVTPQGNTVSMTHVEATINQYGDYTSISDRLELEAVDPIIMGVTEEHGAQAGETQDILTRDVLMAGTNIIHPTGKNRANLGASDVITPTLIDQAVAALKKQKTPLIDGHYVAIIHPSVAYDLRENSAWIEAHKYAQPEEIYNGEIGMLHNVRFIETTNAKVWKGSEDGTATNTAVYSTLVFGKDAWGIVEPSAESMEVIVKQRGSAGTADPLDQRSSVGFKFSTAAAILYPERMVSIETGSFFSGVDDAN